MIKLIPRVVCDAGPIIHLDELNCLDLLADFQEILVPSKVYEEAQRHRPAALQEPNLSFTVRSVDVHADERLYAVCRIFSLDAGETEALILIKKNPDAILLTDDASARLVAEQMGFRVHGTIGILIRSIRRGLRTPEEVMRTLAELPTKSTLHMKHSLLKEISLRIKEEYRIR